MNSIHDKSRSARRSRLAELRLDELPEESKNYFIQALDPYHDFNYEPVGCPDGRASTSFIRTIKQRKTLSMPSTFDPEKTFNIHVFTSPFQTKTLVATMELDTYPDRGLDQITYEWHKSANNNHHFSYVTIAYVQEGKSVVWDCFDQSLDVDGDAYRTVGLGIEAHNTTAELYKSGSCTVYRSNPYEEQISSVLKYKGAETQYYAPLTYKAGHVLPKNVEQANALATSITWEANEGFYLVAPPLMDNPFTALGSRAVVQMNGTDTNVNHLVAYCPVPTVLPGPIPEDDYALGVIYRFEPSIANNVYTTGAVLTGLDPRSTFTLDTRLIIETQPGFSSSTISLAKPCIGYDPKVQELIRKVISVQPPGTQVKNNSLGKWWSAIKSVVRQIVPALSAVPGPIGAVAKAVGATDAAIGAVANAVNAGRQIHKKK